MKRLFKDIEEVSKRQVAARMRAVEVTYGIELEIFKERRNVASSVYGTDSGEIESEGTTIVGIITGDDFFPTSDFMSGGLDQAWLYTSSDYPERTDEVHIVSEDGKSRKFKITSTQAIGTTMDVFFKHKLSSLGD